MSINFGKGLLITASLAIGGLACSGATHAADVFAEPVATKGGSGFELTAFPAAGERGVSFNLQLPQGLKGIDLSKCGGAGDDGMSRCAYSAESGKLNVILVRLDGEPLAAREYSLGQVILPGVAREKLLAVEPIQVVGAQQPSSVAGREDGNSTKAER